MPAGLPGRNDPCPCGSGKKYKRCCLEKDREAGPPQSGRAEDEEDMARAMAFAAEVETLPKERLDGIAQALSELLAPGGALAEVRYDPGRFAVAVAAAIHRSKKRRVTVEGLFRKTVRQLVDPAELDRLRGLLGDVKEAAIGDPRAMAAGSLAATRLGIIPAADSLFLWLVFGAQFNDVAALADE